MTPEQEYVYYNWYRIGWCSLDERALAIVVLRPHKNSTSEYAVWTQNHEFIDIEYFTEIRWVREKLQRLGVYEVYPDFQV